MSSHHIVREKQEPALYIQSLAGFDHEHLGQLLEWSPVVLVDEKEYERVHAIGIKMDTVIAAGKTDDLQAHITTIESKSDNFSTALKYLVTGGHTAVNVVTDVFDLKEAWFFADKISMVILCDRRKIYPVKSGFTKWLAAGELLRLHQPVELSQHGNLEKLNDTDYRVIRDGFISLSFQEPMLFISESID
ncbi:MAG: thiamine diphosphokinase [Mucilaginibacter polytrichastri]|nr:thiamine diphosphokinase [Mucilaginibacter polytrichastri]